MPTVIRRAIKHLHPSAFLLAAQLLLLFLYSAFDGLHSQRALITVIGLLVLVLRVWVINRSPAANWIGWALAVPAFILTVVSVFTTNSAILVWSAVFDAGLYFYSAISLIAYMMEDYEVTTDELYAAGATFTLLAWGFGYIFLICELVVPGSFVNSFNTRNTFTFIELLFVSFSNLSTCGLSDILPASTIARVFLMIEQLVGVGYVAIVISRLVGLTIQRQKKSRPDPIDEGS